MYVPDINLRGLNTCVNVTGFKRLKVPVPGKRTHARRKTTHTTEAQSAPVAREINLRFAVKDLTVFTLHTDVAVKTRFQNKTEGQVIAQSFGAFKPETRTGIAAGSHGKRVVATFGVLIGKARVDDAVERYVRRQGCAGECAQNRNCGECLFHDVV